MSTKVFCWYHKVGREEARLSSLFKLWQQNKTSADIVFGNWFLFTDVTKKYNFMKITLQVHVGFGPIFKSLLFLNRCFKKKERRKNSAGSSDEPACFSHKSNRSHIMGQSPFWGINHIFYDLVFSRDSFYNFSNIIVQTWIS